MIIKEGEPIRLENAVLHSKMITDSTIICIVDKEGRTLQSGEWYRDKILQYGARYVRPRWINGQRALICELIDIDEEVKINADKRIRAEQKVQGEHEQRERSTDEPEADK